MRAIPPPWTAKVNRLRVQTFRTWSGRARVDEPHDRRNTAHAGARWSTSTSTGCTPARPPTRPCDGGPGDRVPGRVDRGQRRALDRQHLRPGGGGVPRLGDLLVGAHRPRPLGDRLHQQQPPAVPPRGERPAALVRLPPRARDDPLAAGVGAAARPRAALDAARARPGGRDGRDASSSTTSPARCPASVTLEWLGYPQDEWQMVLRHLPRRLRVPRRLARAPEGLEGLRPGAGPHRRGAPRPHRVAA